MGEPGRPRFQTKGGIPLALLYFAWVRGESARRSGPTAERDVRRRRWGRAHWEACSDGGLRTARKRRSGRAHWRGCSGGGLYSAARDQCTKSRRNGAASVQSRRRREARCTQPRRNEVRSEQSWAVRTGRPVRMGVCALPGNGGRAVRTGGVVSEGVCALPAATSVHTPGRTRSPVRIAASDGNRSVQTPVPMGSAVYTPVAGEGRRGSGSAETKETKEVTPFAKMGTFLSCKSVII